MPLFSATARGCSLSVRVTARAGKTGIAGVRDNMLLVKLAAAPVDGAANDALVALLAEVFAVPRRAVRITSGERSRTKRLEIAGASPHLLEVRLAELLDGT